ncbi:TA system antitoxin ParD family protein [Occallatibacter savannae]|uniref:TA system antitoxin ParD family protein n=1 Tax=Occallatibacter savannae TaxID=1002691 RepID=UPI0013A59356|nr:hypothetical protein [Occallatibacter savannae]
MKLSDALVLDARIVGDAQERSIAGQVEFWAKLGRGVEALLEGRQVLALSRNANATPLTAAIESVETSRGRRQLSNYLQSLPYPHYEPHPKRKGMLVRTERDGTKTVGKFVNREFVPEGRMAPKRETASRIPRTGKVAGARG